MKRLILGDIHGHWNTIDKIYWKEQPDEVIILGDYVDSFGVNVDEQYECFLNILTLRKIHNEKHNNSFILLLGNHDFHYIIDTEQYSGYNWRTESWARNKFLGLVENKIFQNCFIDNVNKTIYSHAGVTNTWLENTYMVPISDAPHATIYEINDLSLDFFKFNHKHYSDMYGNSVYQGPLWVRPEALSSDMYKDNDNEVWTQLVGHTHMNNATWINDKLLVLDSLPNNYCIEIINEENKKIESRIIQEL